jgi:flagellar protein FlbD
VIVLTRLNGEPLLLNCDLIECVETVPDTVLTLTSGNKLIVRDSMEQIQAKIVDFKRKIYAPNESI